MISCTIIRHFVNIENFFNGQRYAIQEKAVIVMAIDSSLVLTNNLAVLMSHFTRNDDI